MDTAQWPQEIVVKPMEEIVVVTTTTTDAITCPNSVLKPTNSLESCKRVRPQKEQQVLNCPRCNSTNTKFCYYNNYSLSQPRYFCKTCRRYWTEGGTLRNIPVGGGSRKNNKRSSANSSSSSISQSSSASSKKLLPAADHDLVITQLPLGPLPPNSSHQNPNKIHHDGQDLNLGFSESTTCDDFKTISQLIQVPNFDNIDNNNNNSNKNMKIPNNSQLSAMELLTGIQSSRGLINSFMPILPNTTFYSSSASAGFPLTTDHHHHQFMKQGSSALSFSLDNELGSSTSSGYNNGSGRLLFPFEDLKMQPSNNTTDPPTDDSEHHNVGEHGGDHSNGFWNGMLGTNGGSWQL